jgi:NitT/TauT family transport system ATP-binding protein
MKVKCQNLSKWYHTRNRSTKAIENISFESGEQEFLCILGPSGCGKTTLLKIIAGLLEPSEGEVSYEGTTQDGRRLNAMVFQEHGIFPWMNVIDNVAFGLEMRGVLKNKRHQIASEVIQKVGLKGLSKSYPHELSVGMKQRVGLARTIASDPEILLMDEPFGSLDAQTKLILQDELLEIWSQYNKPIIYVTHDIEEAVLLSDRIVVLTSSPGRIKEEIDIGLRRPRNMEMRGSKRFIEFKMRIWHLIEDEVRKSMGRGDDEGQGAGPHGSL